MDEKKDSSDQTPERQQTAQPEEQTNGQTPLQIIYPNYDNRWFVPVPSRATDGTLSSNRPFRFWR